MKYYFLILFSLLLVGCNPNIEEKQLLGTWKVTNMELGASEASQKEIDRAKSFAMSETYSFSDDNTFSIKGQYYTATGQWQLKESKLVLIFDEKDQMFRDRRIQVKSGENGTLNCVEAHPNEITISYDLVKD